MKNEMIVRHQGWFKGFILALFLLPGVSCLSAPTAFPPFNCPIQNLTKTDQSSGSVSYSWAAISGVTEYKVWYTRTNDNYTSSVTTTGSTSITFSGLPAGSYHFYFAAVCGQGFDWIVDDVIMI